MNTFCLLNPCSVLIYTPLDSCHCCRQTICQSNSIVDICLQAGNAHSISCDVLSISLDVIL